MRIRKKALRKGNIVRIGEIVHYSTKIYRKSREMSVINHEKIIHDDKCVEVCSTILLLSSRVVVHVQLVGSIISRYR